MVVILPLDGYRSNLIIFRSWQGIFASLIFVGFLKKQNARVQFPLRGVGRNCLRHLRVYSDKPGDLPGIRYLISELKNRLGLCL